MNWLIDFFENINTADRTFAHPAGVILLHFLIFYFALGINVAEREKHISKRVIPPLRYS